MSGEMQENSDIAVRLASEETQAGGMTTPVLWRAEASLRMERMASALVTASKEADYFFREVSYCSHYPRFDAERDVPDVETSNWRAVCGKTASTVRREGRRKPSLPLSAPGGCHSGGRVDFHGADDMAELLEHLRQKRANHEIVLDDQDT